VIRWGNLIIVEGDQGCGLRQVTHTKISLGDAKNLKQEASNEHSVGWWFSPVLYGPFLKLTAFPGTVMVISGKLFSSAALTSVSDNTHLIVRLPEYAASLPRMA
jgi:hypothetical protein